MNAKPTAEELAAYVTMLATAATGRDDKARKELAEAALAGRVLDSYTLKPAMEAQAKALPWRLVLRRAEKSGDVVAALAEVREELTENLLDRGESQSTCVISNDTDRLNREAAREFLRTTRRMA
jgi:hypothetical protein